MRTSDLAVHALDGPLDGEIPSRSHRAVCKKNPTKVSRNPLKGSIRSRESKEIKRNPSVPNPGFRGAERFTF